MTAPAEPRIDGVIVRFGEIGIKSAPVRSAMLERLKANLLDRMIQLKVEGDVERRGARLWMVGANPPGLVAAARLTFGVVSASPCMVVPATMEGICNGAVDIALPQQWTSFAIRARREGQHPFSSQDVQVTAGSAVFVAAQKAGRTPKVDLGKPELEVQVDIRQDKAYIFTHEFAGPGGIPLGTQGKVGMLLSDEASFVSAWLLMRRGVRLVPIHAGDTGSVPAEQVTRLAQWGMSNMVDLLPVCSGKTSKKALLEAACHVAADHGATAIATGDTLDSQLLVGLPMPVLRPVCGLARSEYDSVLARLGLASGACSPMTWPDPILDEASRETAATLLSMRRTVTA